LTKFDSSPAAGGPLHSTRLQAAARLSRDQLSELFGRFEAAQVKNSHVADAAFPDREGWLDVLTDLDEGLDLTVTRRTLLDSTVRHPLMAAGWDSPTSGSPASFWESQIPGREASSSAGGSATTPIGADIGQPPSMSAENWREAAVGLLALHSGIGAAGPLTPIGHSTSAGGVKCSVNLVPDKPAPQLVGDQITWTATLQGDCGDTPVFQFSAGPEGGPLQMVRDFNPNNTFPWAPIREGNYSVVVMIEDGYGGNFLASALVNDTVAPRVTGKDPVVTPLANPLVALYSAPPCTGFQMQVFFRAMDDPIDTPWRHTNVEPCVPGLTENFLVAGMRADTTYEMVGMTDHQAAPPVFFATQSLPSELTFPNFTVVQPPGPLSDVNQNIVFHMGAGHNPRDRNVDVLATDLAGNPLWYYDPVSSGLNFIWPVSLAPGGNVLMVAHDPYHNTGYNVLRETDLAGNPVRETNVDALSPQLQALGQSRVYSFHHDAQRLPDGTTAVLAYTQQTFDVKGTPTDFMGNALLVLDANFQVVWAWNSFDFLDPRQVPVLGVRCRVVYGDNCPVPNPDAIDYLHANSVAWSPADSNLIMSLYTQSWVIKVNYNGGTGDGRILWTLGTGGDFSIQSKDPYPWFSNQHDAHYIDDHRLVVYDNGVTRCQLGYGCNSRGQMLVLDEKTLDATLVVNADLGVSSFILGSGQLLSNGNYLFESGAITNPDIYSQSTEVLPDGTITYILQRSDLEYRSARMSGLYDGIQG
jgi:hypothetical protein